MYRSLGHLLHRFGRFAIDGAEFRSIHNALAHRYLNFGDRPLQSSILFLIQVLFNRPFHSVHFLSIRRTAVMRKHKRRQSREEWRKHGFAMLGNKSQPLDLTIFCCWLVVFCGNAIGSFRIELDPDVFPSTVTVSARSEPFFGYAAHSGGNEFPKPLSGRAVGAEVKIKTSAGRGDCSQKIGSRDFPCKGSITRSPIWAGYSAPVKSRNVAIKSIKSPGRWAMLQGFTFSPLGQ